jgi:hypothetical protein
MGKPFEKGDPRINRKGRPKKGSALTDILSTKLDEENKSGALRREVIAEKLLKLAEGGDLAAVKYVFDRIDGRPRESVELTGNAVDIRLKEIMNDGK